MPGINAEYFTHPLHKVSENESYYPILHKMAGALGNKVISYIKHPERYGTDTKNPHCGCDSNAIHWVDPLFAWHLVTI